MTRRIVVGVDGSAASEVALFWALEQAQHDRAEVVAVSAYNLLLPAAVTSNPYAADDPGLERACREMLDDVISRSRRRYPVQRVVRQGAAVRVLVEASEDADLLVVGAHGRGGLAALLRGSVSHACTMHAACPVVVVRTDATGVRVDLPTDLEPAGTR